MVDITVLRTCTIPSFDPTRSYDLSRIFFLLLVRELAMLTVPFRIFLVRVVHLLSTHSHSKTPTHSPTKAGTWQKNKLMPNMPFDAVLVASRVMVAKEASTALEVKRLIVKTPGLNFESEHLWESSYDGDAGGVLTVQSELGEPIHKIANRGTWCSSARIFIVSLKYFTRITVHQTQVHDCGETSIDDTSELRARPNRSARSSF